VLSAAEGERSPDRRALEKATQGKQGAQQSPNDLPNSFQTARRRLFLIFTAIQPSWELGATAPIWRSQN
jgi:hypothetical protein